jgi:hypothetical protein
MSDSKIKEYGYVKDGTLLTDASAEEIVGEAFGALKAGKGRVIKSPDKIRLKTSVTKLPPELQQAAQYK